MSLIQVSNLTFGYEGSFDNVFENASFSIDTNWRCGFIGRNGRGKTTFLNLLLGKYAYSGTISASVNFEYFPFEVENPDDTPLEIAESIMPDFEIWRLTRELNLLDADPGLLYRPYSTLSYGERTKVLLSILFIRENSFLLIDEPTNHLDIEARDTLAQYLKSKKGFILVSHDRAFLDEVIDHVLSINRADITVMRGNFTTWQQEKDREDQFELQQNEKLKKDVKRLEAAARRSAEWSNRAEDRKIGFKPERTEKTLDRRAYEGEKSRKMMKRAKSIESRRNDALEEKSALLKNIESADTKLQIATLRHPKDLLVEANDLSVDYGDGPIFPPLRFEIRRGDRAALQGKNGCGKSSIIKLLCGEDVPHTGTLKTASGLVVSYIPQSAEGLSGTLRDYAEHCGIDESLFKSILRKLEFQRTQFEKRMEDFSEGQKKKVLIARSLCEKAHLLVWDEPLNFIDVISRMQLETLLKECVPTVIFVEHDRRFVENVATKIIRL